MQQLFTVGSECGIFTNAVNICKEIKVLGDRQRLIEYQSDPLGHQSGMGLDLLCLFGRMVHFAKHTDLPFESVYSGNSMHQ